MKRVLLSVCLILALVVPVIVPQPPTAAAAGTFADPGMQSVWQRTDQPVEQLKVSRTWVWGPEGFATRLEPYAETQGGQRTVQYFDKSRMEINSPNGDRGSQWFVTNGLLTRELITGEMQVGDNKVEIRYPAMIPVAGDPDDTNAPTYASFAGLLDKAAHNPGDQLTESVDKFGNVTAGGPPTGVTAAYYVPESKHTVAGVFWDFLNSSSTVYQGGKYVNGRLFDPTFFATGFPITEAYWAKVKVGGVEKNVLIQAFERRVLTYTPDNPDGWKVEMGNVGRHYYDWRYNSAGMPPATPDLAADIPASTNGGWVYPKYGAPGSLLVVSASGFQPNEGVGFWINATDGSVSGAPFPIHADENGVMFDFPVTINEGAVPGIYSVVFHGVESGREAVVYFKIVTKDQMPQPLPAAPLPRGWGRIIDTDNGYKVGIPEGWKGFKADSPEMQQFISEIVQINPEMAEGWYQAPLAAGVLKAEIYDPSVDIRSNGIPTDASVSKEKMHFPLTVDQYAWMYGPHQVKNMIQERILTPNGDLIVFKFHLPRGGGLSDAYGVSVIGVSGEYAYKFDMTTTVELESQYAPLFDQMARQFHILPAQ